MLKKLHLAPVLFTAFTDGAVPGIATNRRNVLQIEQLDKHGTAVALNPLLK
jgi:hypothetical protein